MNLLFTYYNTPTDIAYSTGVIALYGSLTTIFGVVASFIAAICLKKKKTFKAPLRFILFGLSLVVINGIFALPSLNLIWVGISLLLLGVFIVPIIPISYAYANQLTFPVEPSLT